VGAPSATQAASLSTKGYWEQNRSVSERLVGGARGTIVRLGEDFSNFYNDDIVRGAVAVPRVRALLDACREGLERTLDVSRAWPISGVFAMARPMSRKRA